MRIDAGLDTGDMLLKWETAIGAEETAVELGERLAVRGRTCWCETLAELAAGDSWREKQDDAQATYAPHSEERRRTDRLERRSGGRR